MCIAYNGVNDRAHIDTDENAVYLNFAPLVSQDQVSQQSVSSYTTVVFIYVYIIYGIIRTYA